MKIKHHTALLTVLNFLEFTINDVLRPTFICKLCYKLRSVVAFTYSYRFFLSNCAFYTEWRQSCSVCL